MKAISIKGNVRRRTRLLAVLAILILSTTLLATALNLMNGSVKFTGPGAQIGNVVEVELVIKYVNGSLNLVLPLQTNYTKASNSTLFFIIGSTETSYMRNFVGEVYSNGLWYGNFSNAQGYGGEKLNLVAPKYADSETEKNIIIKPAADLQGVIPTMKDTSLVSVLPRSTQTDLSYYPDQELFYSSKSFNIPYNLSYAIYNFDPQVLNKATVEEDTKYISVPESMVKDLKSLAENITKNAVSPYEKAKKLESYLQSNYVYSQNLTAAPNGVDPIEWFLFHDKKGVCTQFNTAFVLMARTLGLTARLVGGYAINSTKEDQEVTPQDSHAYSEILFNGFGWVTFDATAPVTNKVVVKAVSNVIEHRYNQSDIPGYIKTYTTILSSNKIGVKGDNFTVTGTVTSRNSQRIRGLTVQITLAKNKLEQGTFVGDGLVNNGFFNIICTIPSNFTLGDYNIIARALGNGIYNGSSSDPIITIMTHTKINLITAQEVVYGRPFYINGTLEELGTEKPISNMTVTLDVDALPRTLITDKNGVFSMPITLSGYGVHNVTASFSGKQYYLASLSEKQVKVPELSILPLSDNIIRGENNSLVAIVLAADLPVEKEDVLISMNGTVILSATTDANGYMYSSYNASPDLKIGNVTLDYKLKHFENEENQTVKVMAKTFISVETTNFLGKQIDITPKLVDNLGTPIVGKILSVSSNITSASSLGITDVVGRASLKLEVSDLAMSNNINCSIRFDGSKYLLPSELTLILIPPQESSAVINALLVVTILAIIGLSIAIFSIKDQLKMQKAVTVQGIGYQEQDEGSRRQFFISFPQIREQFALVWGEREPLEVQVKINTTQHKDAHMIVDDGRMGKLELRTGDELTKFALEKGTHTFAIVEKDSEIRDSEIGHWVTIGKKYSKIVEVKIRIVNYREEVVRLYSEYFLSLKKKDPRIVEETTPREFESIVKEDLPANKLHSLESMVSLFEVANYSLHTITGREYEEMYVGLQELKRNE